MNLDNDISFNTDREYTGGGDILLDFEHISIVYKYRLYTPRTIITKTPLPGEHPYAAYQRIGLEWRDSVQGKRWHFGIYQTNTGPQLNGGGIQNTIHEHIAKQAEGWETQISDFTGNQVSASYGYYHRFNRYLQIYYGLGGDYGDVFRYGYAEFSTQFGYGIDGYAVRKRKLSADMQRLRYRWLRGRFQFFFTFEYKDFYIFRDATLEGNRNDYAYAVERKEAVSSRALFLTIALGPLRLYAGATEETPRYTTQESPHQYATLGLGYTW